MIHTIRVGEEVWVSLSGIQRDEYGQAPYETFRGVVEAVDALAIRLRCHWVMGCDEVIQRFEPERVWIIPWSAISLMGPDVGGWIE